MSGLPSLKVVGTELPQIVRSVMRSHFPNQRCASNARQFGMCVVIIALKRRL